MPRKLKTYRTSVGFFDLAIAAPSMKAAAEAWGTDTDVFRRGFAEQVDDPEVIAATMAKPGVILKRPVGSSGAFKKKAELPKNLPDLAKKRIRQSRSKGRKPPHRKPDP